MQSGIWVVVLAADDDHGADSSVAPPASVREQLSLAAALAPRPRVHAVVSQKSQRRLESALWLLLRSNVLTLPDGIGSGYGVLLALLGISERHPDARVVLLSSAQRAPEDASLLEWLRTSLAEASGDPDYLTQLSAASGDGNGSAVVGHAGALLELFEPDTVAAIREMLERPGDTPAVTAQIIAQAGLPYLDFHRHVLPAAQFRVGQRELPLGATGAI